MLTWFYGLKFKQRKVLKSTIIWYLHNCLRTVPSFVSALTFCTSRKPWFSSTRALGLTLMQSTTLSCTRLKWNQNVPTVTKSSLMNLYLNQEHHNSSISLTTDCTSSSWKPSCYLSKIILKSNCKHAPADGVVRVQNKCEMRKCLTYWGGYRKKCNGHHKSFQKGSITLKNTWVPLHFMLWNGSGKSIQHVISFWLWAKGI